MDIPIPNTSMVPVDLEPVVDDAVLMSGATRAEAESPIAGSLAVGVPIATRLSAEWARDDRDLSAFIRHEAHSHRYWLIHLACTFTKQDKVRIVSGTLTCYLDRADGGGENRPLAWSMTPERLRDVARLRLSTRLRLSADLKVITPAVELRRESEGAAVKDMIVGRNLQQSEPFWTFVATDRFDLDGSFRFALVVRAPLQVHATYRIRLSGQARGQRWKIFSYQAPLLQVVSGPFVLP